MKPNELRIGNITDKGTIKSFYENGVHVGMGKIYEFFILKPVPLTEQLLFDFGAIKKSDIIIYFDRFRLMWKKDYKYWYVSDKERLTYLTKIEFVHEFQNFVFAMNSEELKLKIKNK
jgi:hypothetical protein